LKIIEAERLLENVRSRGDELRTGLQGLAGKFDFIREVRAEGLMIGIQLSVEGAALVAEAAKQGLLINCTHEYIIRLLPPFIVTRAQVREFLKKFESVLAAVSANSSSAEKKAPVTKSLNSYATAR
jgi:acetylornithine/N-succinyldiaminopimelate aminotransferase